MNYHWGLSPVKVSSVYRWQTELSKPNRSKKIETYPGSYQRNISSINWNFEFLLCVMWFSVTQGECCCSQCLLQQASWICLSNRYPFQTGRPHLYIHHYNMNRMTRALNHYDWSLTAAVGGVLGLGFGFSFISLIEILYFFAIRFLFRRRLNSILSSDHARTRTVRRRENTHQRLFQQPNVSVIQNID